MGRVESGGVGEPMADQTDFGVRPDHSGFFVGLPDPSLDPALSPDPWRLAPGSYSSPLLYSTFGLRNAMLIDRLGTCTGIG